MVKTENLAKLFEPAQSETLKMIDEAGKNLPYFISSALIFVVALILAYLISSWTRSFYIHRKSNVLLASAAGKTSFIVVLFLGIYLSLLTSGLSKLAVTFLGGTGLIGIGLGFALKGTFENYFAGLIISMKDIFRKGEVVKINEYEGIIQSVTTRGTTLMDYDGNSIILPNAHVIASPIKNLTRNPKMRLYFDVGVGYEDDLQTVKDLIQNFFDKHSDKILSDPEPSTSVMSLGSATVNLRVYFWINTTQVSQFKIKSWVIHSIKNLLMENNVSMPDDAREIVFASALEINQTSSHPDKRSNGAPKISPHPQKPKHIDFLKEKVELKPELEDLREQALSTEPPEKGQSLI